MSQATITQCFGTGATIAGGNLTVPLAGIDAAGETDPTRILLALSKHVSNTLTQTAWAASTQCDIFVDGDNAVTLLQRGTETLTGYQVVITFTVPFTGASNIQGLALGSIVTT